MSDQTENGKKTHMNDLLPKPHIRTSDFKGKDVTLTVKGHGTIEVYNREMQASEEKGVLYFNETGKYLFVNKTQLEQIAKVLKSEWVDDWIGQRITLYVTRVKAFGKMEDAVRIKASAAPAPNPPAGQPVEEPQTKQPQPAPEAHQSDIYTQFWSYGRDACNLDEEALKAILEECGDDFEKGVAVLKEQHTPPEKVEDKDGRW